MLIWSKDFGGQMLYPHPTPENTPFQVWELYSRDFANPDFGHLSCRIWGRQSEHPKSPILDFESQFLQKPTSSNPSHSGVLIKSPLRAIRFESTPDP